MKKAVLLFAAMVFAVLSFSAGAVSAQEKQIFLSLTKSDIDIDELPTNVTIISQKEIEDAHVETLGELLAGSAGIDFMAYGAAGSAQSISIRGESNVQTLVLIDGRKVNLPNLGIADFSHIPTQNIERVEIIRGAGASIYGSGAFGGVINVITKKAEDNSPILDGNISYGAFNTLNPWAIGAYKNQNFGALLSISYYSSDGERDNSDFKNFNGFFSGQSYLTENSNLSLTGQVYDSQLGVPGGLTYLSPDARQKDNNMYAKLDYNLALDKNYLTVSAYIVENKEDYDDPSYSNPFSASKNKYTGKAYGAQAEFHLGSILLLGIEGGNDNFENEDSISPDASFERSRDNFAGYTQLNLNIGNFKILPSFRVDNNSQFGTQAAPAISAIFNAAKEVKISANVGQVWRSPTFNELYTNNAVWSFYGNPNLKPEKGLSVDLGADYTGEKFKLNTTGFFIESEDLITYVSDPVTWASTYENLSKAQSYGVEVSGGQIITTWLEHRVNYAYLQTKDESEGVNKGKYITFKPQNTVKYSLILRPLTALTIIAVVSFRDEVYTDAANTAKLNGFSTLDININYKVNENFSLWLKGFNLADAKYELYTGGYPMPGTAVYGGVNIKLFR
ncbi:MAG: TonB-dependent receptor [Elusimicrobiota bacterium]|jgi:outer membrane cobalamin receptor|nr:TonB-dependent receptor [Elusimicrobiota bacterium]